MASRPGRIIVEEALTPRGEWVEKRRWTKADSWPFNEKELAEYVERMEAYPFVLGVRFVVGEIAWREL